MKSKFKKFTPAEDTYIKTSHQIMSPEDIAEVLKREPDAVKRRIKRLGLEIPDKYKYSVFNRIKINQCKAGFLEGK